MKKGVELLSETVGDGDPVGKRHFYQIKLRAWLNRGEQVKWEKPWGLVDRAEIKENGHLLITDVRYDREFLISGLFYGIEGMRVGGVRKLRISPHLAYGAEGVPGIIPSNALLVTEVEIVEERYAAS